MNLFESPMRYFWWLVRPLYFWVSSRPTNEPVEASLTDKKAGPVVYIIPRSSVVDLLVLYFHCRKMGLPLPKKRLSSVINPGDASYLYLRRSGVFQTRRTRHPAKHLTNLIQILQRQTSFHLQLVPVSVFWGQNPGKEESSFFKLLFNDDESAGIFQKFFIVLAQARNTVIHFGKSLPLRELVDEGGGYDQTARKLTRILRVHFRRKRNQVLGQKLYVRDLVISRVSSSRAVQEFIGNEAEKTKIEPRRLKRRSREYTKEIAADMTYSVVQLLKNFVRWLWSKLFDGYEVNHLDVVTNLVQKDYEIIYVPTHRSHMDYLFLNYSVYMSGLPNPHTAAGINLNFFPIGWFLRRGGAFFIRRSFSGNKLYTVVFHQYLHYLLTNGYHISFFPEGKRSRSGRLLPPRLGFLGMIIKSFLHESKRPLALVPITLSYDKVPEVASYLRELRGASKREESFFQFLKARSLLKQSYGKSYLNFGQPILLSDFLQSYGGAVPRARLPEEQFQQAVRQLAGRVAVGINQAAVAYPSALLAMVLLSSRERAMTEDDVEAKLVFLIQVLQAMPEYSGVFIPEHDPKKIIASAARIASYSRFSHPGGNVLYLSEFDALSLSYQRNNILHLFALPSLVASSFQHRDRVDRDSLVEACLQLYPFLKEEFFLPWPVEDLPKVIDKVAAIFVGLGALKEDGRDLVRPLRSHSAHYRLRNLGAALAVVLERYAISTQVLVMLQKSATITQDDFLQHCVSINQRVALLSGLGLQESGDQTLFSGQFDLMVKLGYLQRSDDGNFALSKKITDLYEKTTILLSEDMKQVIDKLSKKMDYHG